jgi:hypothetical protein
MATTTPTTNHAPKLVFGEALSFAYATFCSNKVQFSLTALGMVIGTASLILVVTIGMTGKEYVLRQIQSIGVNMIEAEYYGGEANIEPDPLTIEDMQAILQRVSGIAAASPVVPLDDRSSIGAGRERDLRILGVLPAYNSVRNLVLVSGRLFDAEDNQAHNKVGVMQQELAQEMYGSPKEAIGKVIRVGGLPFTIIGTFRERVDTFGQSEVTHNALLIPFSVSRYLTGNPDGTHSRGAPIPSPARIKLRRPKSYRLSQPRRSLGKCPNPAVTPDCNRDAAGSRYRHHEHYVGNGDLADSRNWNSQGNWRDQCRDSAPVSL